jgi:hypothetical protein
MSVDRTSDLGAGGHNNRAKCASRWTIAWFCFSKIGVRPAAEHTALVFAKRGFAASVVVELLLFA